MTRVVVRCVVSVLLLSGFASLHAQPSPSGEIQLALRKLNELGSVLMIAAHPDDERTEVLAYFARGRSMRAAYLSVTRGEGGQNLLGPEQGAALGIIRTQELLAARRIDGAEQFFTRAIDFGFTKTAEETLRKWGHEAVLSDVVWVIRRYRPDVIVLGFSGTPADGHGQHQSSAILGKEAFDAAGDPARFPEQLKYVQPWKPAKIVTAGFGGGRGGATNAVAPGAQINTTGYSAILGYTYAQLATISRSQHRSQGLGAMGIGGGLGGGRGAGPGGLGGPGGPAASGAQAGGRGEAAAPGATPAVTPAAPAGGRGGRGGRGGAPAVQAASDAPAPDLFEGIEHSWKRLPGGAAIDAILSQAIREFDWDHPERTIPLLAKARPLIAAISDPLAKLKLADLDETIARCAGIWADAAARQTAAAPGSHVAVAVTVNPRLPVPTQVKSIRAEGLWAGRTWTPADAADARIPDYDLEIPASQPYSQPYWLRKPPTADTYSIDDQTLVGRPDPVVEQLRMELSVAGTSIEIVRPIVYRYNDRLDGEKTAPLAVAPEAQVNVSVAPDLTMGVAMFPTVAPRRLQVKVRANFPNVAGSLRLDAPNGWKVAPASQPFQLAAAEDRQELAFEVTPPAAESTAVLHAVATVNGHEIRAGMSTIAYPHIPQQTVFPPSDMKAVRSDIQVTARRIGYIMGAGDDVPEALRQLGLDVALLGEDDLRKADLSRFDAIVAGVRAYNVRADLRANNQRLLDYVANGGTYVVQNVRENVPNIGPYPFTLSTGNSARVTVEEAPVIFTHPDSLLLRKPNLITAKDFDGWVQERGTYFPAQWDPRYETVFSSNDPGEKPLDGGEIWTRHGKGVFVYTAYVWFRQLPAGVPGAYRLFANMLSAK